MFFYLFASVCVCIPLPFYHSMCCCILCVYLMLQSAIKSQMAAQGKLEREEAIRRACNRASGVQCIYVPLCPFHRYLIVSFSFFSVTTSKCSRTAVSKMVWWDSQSFWFARLEIVLKHTACLCVCVCVCVWFPIIRVCPVYLFVCFCVCTRETSPNKASSRTLHCGPKSLWHVQSLFGSSPLDCLKSTFLIFFNLAPLGQFCPAS